MHSKFDQAINFFEDGNLNESEKLCLKILKDDAERNYEHYEDMLNEKQGGELKNDDKVGLSRELARINLTLNTYTQWYWKIDLHNLLHFLFLRDDPHAQYEIQAYAEIILNKIKIDLKIELFKKIDL